MSELSCVVTLVKLPEKCADKVSDVEVHTRCSFRANIQHTYTFERAHLDIELRQPETDIATLLQSKTCTG